MEPDRWQHLCDVFERVRVLAGQDRETALAAEPELRTEVEELLAYHDEAGRLSEATASDPAAIGAYTIERILGEGGMGTVYLAHGPKGRVALKRLHPHLAAHADFRARFQREAELGSRVLHANVVRTLGLEGEDCLAMEFVEGQSLEQLLDEEECLSEELCRHIAVEVTRGLEAIHAAGVVHRDLKPSNVIITPTHEVKVMDLGAALPVDEILRLSRTGQFIGTVRYCAPEQLAAPDDPLDGRADLYALGLLLHELATGQPAIEGKDLPAVMRAQMESLPRRMGELNPQISPFFEELVHVLVAKKPADRLPGAPALLEALAGGTDSGWWGARLATIRERRRRPLRRIRVARETALYGRDDELTQLREVFDQVAGGTGHALLVEGEAGIGKTRLLDEFLRRLDAEGLDVAVLHGAFPSGGAAYGASAFRSAADTYLSGLDLERVLPRLLPETPLLVPAFAAFLRGDAVAEGAVSLDKASMQTTFVSMLAVLASDRPVILTVDDLHFAPDEGRALFSAIALALADKPVLLIGTARHGLPEGWLAELERMEHARRIALARLGPSELGKLLAESLGSDRLVDDLGWMIAKKSDGNPYFVFEILRNLREQGLVRRDDTGTWVTTGSLPTIEIPSSVVELTASRLAGLREAEQELLDIAACHGSPFDGTVLAEALDKPLIPLLRTLGRLEREHRLVHAYGSGFVFDHDQVREVLYERMSPALRIAYHAVLADMLERRAPEPDPAQAAAICRHLLAAGEVARALVHLDPATLHLEATARLESCIELYDQVLAQLGLEDDAVRARMTYKRAQLLRNVARGQECREEYEKAVQLARSAGDVRQQVQATRRLADEHMHAGELGRADEVLAEALSLARDHGDRAGEGSVRGQQGLIAWTRGSLDEAEAHFQDSLAIGQELGDKHVEVYAVAGLGITRGRRGQVVESLEYFERWEQLARELGEVGQEMRALGARALNLRMMGRLSEAEAITERWCTRARESGDRYGLSVALNGMVEVHIGRGRYLEARDAAETSLRLGREVGDFEGAEGGAMQLARIESELGDLPSARKRLEPLRVRAVEQDHQTMAAYLDIVLGEIARNHGDLEEAEHRLAAGRAGIERLGAQQFAPALENAVSGVHLARGDDAGARPHLETMLRLSKERAAVGDQLVAQAGLALIGDLDPESVRCELEASQSRLTDSQLLTTRWRLFRCTQDPALLASARAQVEARLAAVPEEMAARMAAGLVALREVLQEAAPKSN